MFSECGYQEQCYDGSLLYSPGVTDTDVNNPDTDGDGMKDGDEYRAGTSALDANDVFQVKNFGAATGAQNQYVIAWSSVGTNEYRIGWSTNLGLGFQALVSNLPATPPLNTYTDTCSEAGPRYYRIQLEE